MDRREFINDMSKLGLAAVAAAPAVASAQESNSTASASGPAAVESLVQPL